VVSPPALPKLGDNSAVPAPPAPPAPIVIVYDVLGTTTTFVRIGIIEPPPYADCPVSPPPPDPPPPPPEPRRNTNVTPAGAVQLLLVKNCLDAKRAILYSPHTISNLTSVGNVRRLPKVPLSPGASQDVSFTVIVYVVPGTTSRKVSG
jgi:hypothetical protein